MSDNLADVLKEVSGLLGRIAEQNEKSAKRSEEFRLRGEESRKSMQERLADGANISSASRPDFQKSREDMAKRMEESRAISARHREEDVDFRERLLSEIQRHNELLEALISKLNQR